MWTCDQLIYTCFERIWKKRLRKDPCGRIRWFLLWSLKIFLHGLHFFFNPASLIVGGAKNLWFIGLFYIDSFESNVTNLLLVMAKSLFSSNRSVLYGLDCVWDKIARIVNLSILEMCLLGPIQSRIVEHRTVLIINMAKSRIFYIRNIGTLVFIFIDINIVIFWTPQLECQTWLP